MNKNLTTNPHPLQTSDWAEFRKVWGNEVVETKYGFLTLHAIPFSKYKVAMFIKCPLPNKEMLTDLKKLAQEKKILFIKLEPDTPIKAENSTSFIDSLVISDKKSAEIQTLLKKFGAKPGKTLFTPTTFWIDLTKSEEELLSGFGSKTRYNVRLAEKRGVKVEEDNSKKAFERYIELTRETVFRQKFYSHTEKYHRLMWKHLHTDLVEAKKDPIARLFTATYEGTIVTTWILFMNKDTLYYPYGASTFEHKDIQANSLMLWEAIRFGKKNGLKIFDLWGREEGKGFTRFKEGYNPAIIHFLGSWDLITNPLYHLYLVVEKIRWIMLRTKARFSRPTF